MSKYGLDLHVVVLIGLLGLIAAANPIFAGGSESESAASNKVKPVSTKTRPAPPNSPFRPSVDFPTFMLHVLSPAADKIWTLAQKRQIVEESYGAGANVAEVAQRHEVRPALRASWRRQQARMATSSKPAVKFAAVRVATGPTEGVIEIDLSSGCVRVRGIVDAGMLREALAAAR